MIIKSLSRKKASYGQILAYVDASAQPGFDIRNNLPFGDSYEEVKSFFESLAAQLPQRKNGNLLYHEILSIPRKTNIDLLKQQQALYALAHQYIRQRAPDHAVYGRLHVEGHHLHVHLVISPNALHTPQKRVRLSKADYAETQKSLEKWLIESYPELQNAPVYTKERFGPKKTEKETQYEQRTGKQSNKAQLRLALEHLFSQADTQESLKTILKKYGMELYYRKDKQGNPLLDKPGIFAGNRRYRLSTLGLTEAFFALEAQSKSYQDTPSSGHEALKESPNLSAKEFAEQRARLAADRLTHLLRDLFQYAPDKTSLEQELTRYGVRLDERTDGVWCIHEGMEAPLRHMGLLEEYSSVQKRLGFVSRFEQQRIDDLKKRLTQDPEFVPLQKEQQNTPLSEEEKQQRKHILKQFHQQGKANDYQKGHNDPSY